jgi:hypothetical protein
MPAAEPSFVALQDYRTFFKRYCHNDWANKTDPMGTSDYALAEHYAAEYGTKVLQNEKVGELSERGSLMEYAMLNVGRINFRSLQDNMQGFTNGARPQATQPRLAPWQSPVKVTGGTFRERQYMRKELKKVLKTPRGKELADMIKKQGLQRVIQVKSHWNNADSDTPGQLLRIDPYFHPPIATTQGTVYASTARIIGHELGHAVTGAGANEDCCHAMDNVRQNENPIATHLSPSEPERTQY